MIPELCSTPAEQLGQLKIKKQRPRSPSSLLRFEPNSTHRSIRKTRHSTSITLTHHLLEFYVFGFGLLQNRNVGVGILPQREEILIRRARLGFIARHRVRPPQLQVCQWSNDGIEHDARVI